MNDDTQQLVNEITTATETETSNDNQEQLVDKMDDSQEPEDHETDDSQELKDETDDFQELEDEMDDSQKPAVVVDEWVMEIEGRRLEKQSSITDSNFEKRTSIIGKWQCWDDFVSSFYDTLVWSQLTFTP